MQSVLLRSGAQVRPAPRRPVVVVQAPRSRPVRRINKQLRAAVVSAAPVQASALSTQYAAQAATQQPSSPGVSVVEEAHTTFRWPGRLGGQQVVLSGSWDNWDSEIVLHKSPDTGDFVTSMALPEGSYQYKFKVDGAWRTSPCEPLITAEGVYNNLRVIGSVVTFTWEPTGSHAQGPMSVVGEWSGWTDLMPLTYNPATERFEAKVALRPGKYAYRYYQDGRYLVKGSEPKTAIGGRWFNMVEVQEAPAFKLFYATGWDSCRLRYRYVIDGQPGEWEVKPLHHAPSRANPQGGAWFTITVPVPRHGLGSSTSGSDSSNGGSSRYGGGADGGRASSGMSASTSSSNGGGSARSSNGNGGAAPISQAGTAQEQVPNIGLDFTLLGPATGTTDSWGSRDDSMDKPSDAATYYLPRPGGWKLVKGKVNLFRRAMQPPIMLCSDIDGTMIGSGAEADARTSEFTHYWENTASLAGSVLVYNTGRSLGAFAKLHSDMGGKLALPDVLITAVGTKIWHLKDANRGHSSAYKEFEWVEDEGWRQRLDDRWDLGEMRKAGDQTMNSINNGSKGEEGGAAWLDRGDEHPHRLAFSVRVDLVSEFKRRLEERIAEVHQRRGTKARVIVSGSGGYRYVDVVAHLAGKLEALEYVRVLYGIPVERCVSAGDSGNDVLMLQGRHPGIIVGNAQQDLLDWYKAQPDCDRLVHTNAPEAAGILEGLARFNLI